MAGSRNSLMSKRYIGVGAAFGLIALIVAISVTRIADYDFWWHLKLGETVFNSGQIYAGDTYSYSFQGQPQFRAEWLGNLVIYLSFKIAGFAGVAILKVILVLLTLLFLYMALQHKNDDQNETTLFASLIVIVLVLFSLRFRLFIRPYLFSFMFFSFFLFLISRYQQKSTTADYFFFPLTQILWSNISVGAIFGPALVFMFLVREWHLNRAPDLRLICIFLIVLAASLLNPETYRIYSLPFSALVLSPYKQTLGEHQPISFQILWGYGFKYTFAYQILALCSMGYLVFMKGWKNIYHLMLFALFFPVSLLQVRMIDFFSLCSTVLAFPVIRRLLTMMPAYLFRKWMVEAALTGLIVLSILTSIDSKTYAFGIGIKEDIFPEGALAFLKKEGITGNMMNSYSFGGYAIWAAPDRKVFIDGRHRHLYSSEFYNAYHDVMKNEDAWKRADQAWTFDYALLDYDLLSRRFPKHLNGNPDWVVVYWDGHSVVYLKRIPQNLPVIEKYGYRIAKPAFYDFGYLQAYIHSKTAPETAEQLKHDIALNPQNQEPLLARVFLLYNMGSAFHEEALQELSKALALKPDLSMEHSAMAMLLAEKGSIDSAKEEIRKALDLDPSDKAAHLLKERLKI